MKANSEILRQRRLQRALHVRTLILARPKQSPHPSGGIVRFSRSLLRSALFLLAFETFCGVRVFAQDPPNIAMGMSPSATYHAGDFDFVDMGTGRLNLRIPLVVDHSQRGKLNFTYSVTYTSTGMWRLVYPGSAEPSKYGISAPAPVTEGLRAGLQEQFYKDPLGHLNYAYWMMEDGYGIGPLHPMGYIPGGGGSMESIDGSGLLEELNREGLANSEDTNGNEMTAIGSSCSSDPCPFTDTLGRTWGSSNSSDVTGCPTGGPVAPTSSIIWTIPGPANTVRTFKFCHSIYNVHTNFTSPNCTLPQYNASPSLMTGIVLPDGTTWRFDYDNNSVSYGDLMAVYPPTGGHISYTWAMSPPSCNVGEDLAIRTVATRTVFDGTNSYMWKYNWNQSFTVFTVTDPMQPVGNDTAYTSVCGFVGFGNCPVNQIQYYSGPSTTGTLLKTVNKTYRSLPNPYICDMGSYGPGPYLLSGVTTVWPNGQQSQVQLTYDSGLTFSDLNRYCAPSGTTYTSSYGLVTSESHSDYYTGNPTNPPLLSVINTSYLALSSAPNASSYRAANILDLPSSVIISDGGGNKCAETDYGYDEYAPDSSGVTQQHVAAPHSIQGNLTSVTKQYFGNPCTSANPSMTPFKTVNHVYDTGMMHTTTDPNQNTTTYAYSPTFYGTYVTQTTMPSTASPNPASHIIGENYDFNTGLLTSFTDQNNNTTNYTYDVMLRPTNVTYPSPDGGQTNFYYPNTTTVEMKKQIDATRWTDSFIYYDGLGRESRNMSVNDEPSPYDQVDTCYDADGRVGFKSYPYQGNGTSTPKVCSGAGDALTYDPLSRVTQVTHSDNSTVLTSYTGRATSVQDEGNGTQRVQRISQVDGLGRLTSVCEVASATQLGSGGTSGACGQDIAGTGFLTAYGYDALSNLTSVSQGGYLPRSFAYDSLSRLVTATNPESGSITYKYDSDTNCSQPNSFATLLVSRTDARGIRTCMRYDALNRLTQKNYSNGTPTATFNFDETSAYGVALANTTGRASSDSTASPNPTGELFSYDKLGRVKINSQCTPQNCATPTVFPINYTYDLLGDILTATNGLGVTLTYSPYNRALRIMGMTSSLSDANHPGTLLSSPHYNAAGSILSESIGNTGSNVNETRTYDARLRLTNITDGSIYSVTIPTSGGYAPDSDILLANDSVNGNWTYAYDAFNRLASASATGQPYTYAYDRFGNRWQQNGPHSSSLSFSGNNNRMDTYSYDAAGNLLNDGTTAYTYDSENRIITATNSTSGAFSYLYDADGRRIRKTMPGNILLDYLYDLSGREMTQVTATGSWYRGEGYAGGRHIATYFNSTTYFNFADWLGTERARSSPGATTACETITSLPFGDAETTSGSCGDPSPMHFTGKERDPESGLDNFGARYDSSQYGRFMTPDWSETPNPVPYASLAYPQSLNLYSYVQNNPLSRTDPNGHCDADGEHHNWLWCAFHTLKFTQTAKEAAAFEAQRQQAIATWNEFRRSEIKAGRPDPALIYTIGAMFGGVMGGGGDFLEEGEGTATPTETEAEPTPTPRTVENGVPQPNANGEFVVGPNGTTVRIPPGYVAEPAANGNGIVYRAPGTTGNANTIRIMGPHAQGGQPTRVIIYNSSGQPTIPPTGRTGTPAQTHTPLE